jgi:hypothetical protein
MLPPRQVVVAKASAGAFALAAGLSLLNGTTEWTAAFRGLFAALVIVCIAPLLYNIIAKSLSAGAAGSAPAPAMQKPAGSPK